MAILITEVFNPDGTLSHIEKVSYDDGPINKKLAQMALDKSDITAIRCLKAEISFPAEWQNYVAALRVISNTGIGPIPDQPAYPKGT